MLELDLTHIKRDFQKLTQNQICTIYILFADTLYRNLSWFAGICFSTCSGLISNLKSYPPPPQQQKTTPQTPHNNENKKSLNQTKTKKPHTPQNGSKLYVSSMNCFDDIVLKCDIYQVFLSWQICTCIQGMHYCWSSCQISMAETSLFLWDFIIPSF